MAAGKTTLTPPPSPPRNRGRRVGDAVGQVALEKGVGRGRRVHANRGQVVRRRAGGPRHPDGAGRALLRHPRRNSGRAVQQCRPPAGGAGETGARPTSGKQAKKTHEDTCRKNNRWTPLSRSAVLGEARAEAGLRRRLHQAAPRVVGPVRIQRRHAVLAHVWSGRVRHHHQAGAQHHHLQRSTPPVSLSLLHSGNAVEKRKRCTKNLRAAVV